MKENGAFVSAGKADALRERDGSGLLFIGHPSLQQPRLLEDVL